MSHTVFFSWQIDRRPREGRNFIDRALEMAVARIEKDLTVEEAARDGLKVDKDTKGVPGSPPIFETILNKINQASIFVADLTFCGVRCDGRPTPNPNVLIEYGWALRALGYHQILPIMNAAHGEPSAESLPFNLAHLRHPITYNLPDDAPEPMRSAVREELSKTLETALRGVLESKEFKAKLPREHKLPLFPPKRPLEGKARFRDSMQPLGSVRDTVAQMVGTPRKIDIYLFEGAATWLRVMPLYDPRRTLLKQDIKKQLPGVATLQFLQSTGEIGFLESEDGGGYYSVSGNNNTHSVCYVFKTGEVWAINTSLAMLGQQMELEESCFTKMLDECVSFLDRLGFAKPYQWIVGMEGIYGLNLIIPNNRLGKLAGPCVTNVIEDQGIYDGKKPATELLKPFFENIFDQCGIKRPADNPSLSPSPPPRQDPQRR